MEKVYYETKPFLCLLFAAASAYAPGMHEFGKFPILMLALSGAAILAMRAQHRGLLTYARERVKRHINLINKN